MPAKFTSHYLYLTDWSAGQLRRLLDPEARIPMCNWSSRKCRRFRYIRIHAAAYAQKKSVPAGFELTHKGTVIASGTFDWHGGLDGLPCIVPDARLYTATLGPI